MIVTVCTPCREVVHTGYTFDLVNLLARHQRRGDVIYYAPCEGTLLSNQRTELVRQALGAKSEAILLIDSDMRFPPDALDQLSKRQVDIVGANYKQRKPPHHHTAARINGDEATFLNSAGRTGIDVVDVVGLGLTLIRAEVFAKISEPWFAMPWDTRQRKHVGEDVYFCAMAKEAGLKIYIDHDISKQVRHAGTAEF